MIKMDVSDGFVLRTCGTASIKQVHFSAGRDRKWSNFDKLVWLAALCRGEKADNRKLEEFGEAELNGVEEREDGM